MGKRGPKPKRDGVAWSPEIAYAVGLIATDGCLSPDGRHLIFVSKDLDQVQQVKDIFGVPGLIRTTQLTHSGKVRSYYRLQWSDVGLYQFFLSIGLTPKKSLSIGSLAIPDAYFFDFLRGHHDGDGSFHSYYDPRWKNSFLFYLIFVSASEQHVVWLREVLDARLGVRGHVTKGKNSSVYQLKYAKKESLPILKDMYSTSGVPCLNRKRLKIEAALRIVGESLP